MRNCSTANKALHSITQAEWRVVRTSVLASGLFSFTHPSVVEQHTTLSSVATGEMLVAMATLSLTYLGTSQSCCWARPQRTTRPRGQTSPHCRTAPAQTETNFS